MSWFNKLKNKYRVIIAVLSWLPLVVAAGVINSSSGGNADNITDAQAAIALACLAVGVFFTVFAVKARRAEVSAARTEKEKAAAQAKAEATAKKTYKINIDTTSDCTTSTGDVGVSVRINNGVSLPLHTKAVGVTFGNCQANIEKSKVGDPLVIKHAPQKDYPESTDIINKRTRARVGRINANLAWSLLDAFDDGFVLVGAISDITGGNGQNYGCNIVIDAVEG